MTDVIDTLEKFGARDESRLEVDDPKHCKQCGAPISFDDFSATVEGKPMVWVDGDWVILEKCHDCWAEAKVDELASECMDRYGGELAEVLDHD